MNSTGMKFAAATLLVSLALPLAAHADTDCKLGQRYIRLAHERLAAAEEGEAQDLLRQSIDACPSYEAYQTLGELQSHSPQRAEQAHAVDAFVKAHALAPDGQARAHTLFRYASLLSRDGDPQNAYPLIRDAQRDDPTSDDIAHLSDRLERQVRNPTQQHIIRGLWDSLYKPLQSGSGQTSAIDDRPSINVPIAFVSGTAAVDDESRANVGLMAKALADPSHAGQRFQFVGHADCEPDETRNLTLSRQRAEAIYRSVVALEPTLNGRIDVVARGSAEPIDPAHDERAHKANGRLQILLN